MNDNMQTSPSNLDLNISLKSSKSWNGINTTLPSNTTHVLIGRLSSLQSHKNNENAQGAAESTSTSTSILLEWLNEKSPDNKDVSCSESILTRNKHKVVMIALPGNASRHNCSIRPDEISSQLSKYVPSSSPKSKMEVICFVRDKDEALASTVACSRVFSAYNRKSSSSSSSSSSSTTNKNMDKDQWHGYVHLTIVLEGDDIETEIKLAKLSKELIHISASTRRAAYLVDAPTNEMNTVTMAQEAKAVIQRLNDNHPYHNVDIDVLDYDYLCANGFGGLCGVGVAADYKPALIVLKYTPSTSNPTKTIAWVGKGIVYDTGGLSIKTKTGMPGMKRDMGGAAAILCAFEAAVQTHFPDNLYALLCIAENSVGPSATRPDDIITLYSGKTIEINNTDAEGRLVLSDGVAYATKHLSPDVVVDMATLTGAQGIATGKYFGAIYCNDDDLEYECIKAGRRCGELTHPLPYAPEFFRKEFKSVVADFKNSVNDRSNAQASCAGQFIAESLDSKYKGKWLHIDMAYPACNANERATGYGVALLLQLFHHGL